jgi:hypothetical protein
VKKELDARAKLKIAVAVADTLVAAASIRTAVRLIRGSR